MPLFQSEKQRYDLYRQVLLDATSPLMDELRTLKDEVHRQREERVTKEEFRSLKESIERYRTDTYNREMIDAKFKDISDEVVNLKTGQMEGRKERQQLVATIIAIISVGFLVLQNLPSLVHGFTK